MIIYLDTNIIIYFVEHNPVWWPKVSARLAAASAAGDTFGISDLTRMEGLVGPIRSGDARLHADFVAFFARPDVGVFPLSAAVCDRAARVRALHNFRTPDALNLAAAIENGCGLFLTNDAKPARFPDVPVEVLT
jgi:predicted nucleic acid-binding protein